MNEDQLLDAIGMIDDEKIREAKMVKRTKRWTAVLLAVALVIFLIPVLLVGLGGALWKDTQGETYPYSLSAVATDIRLSHVVHVNYGGEQQCIEIPADLYDILRIDEWNEAPDADLSDKERLLTLDFVELEMVFYDGYVYVETYDWDTYIGVFEIPSDVLPAVFECVGPPSGII